MSRMPNRPPRRVRCPRCGVRCVWSANPHRPFCSLECRLIDLGGWLDERYRIAGQVMPTESESAEDGTRPGG